MYLPTGILTPLTIAEDSDFPALSCLEAILETAQCPLGGLSEMTHFFVVRQRTPWFMTHSNCKMTHNKKQGRITKIRGALLNKLVPETRKRVPETRNKNPC